MKIFKLRHLIAIIFIICGATGIYTQEKKLSIAVSPFDDTVTGVTETEKAGTLFTTCLERTLTGKCGLIVREANAIHDYLSSMQRVMSGLADPCILKQSSRGLAVNYLAVGTISKLDRKYEIDARIVDVNTWRIVYSQGQKVVNPGEGAITFADAISSSFNQTHIDGRENASRDNPVVAIMGFRDHYNNPPDHLYGGIMAEMLTTGLGMRSSIATIETKYSRNLQNEKILEMTGVIENDNADSAFAAEGITHRILGEIRTFPDLICINYRIYDTNEKRLIFIGTLDISSTSAIRAASRNIAQTIENALINRIGTLKLMTETPGIEIHIDDASYGINGTKPRLIPLEKGNHWLSARRPGYQEFGMNIAISPRTTLPVTVHFTPLNMKLVEEAASLEAAGQYSEAVAKLDEFIRIAGDTPEANSAIYRKGHIELYYLKDYDRALASFRNLLGRYPDTLFRTEGYFGMARAYIELRDKTRARQTLQFLLNNYSDSYATEPARDLLKKL